MASARTSGPLTAQISLRATDPLSPASFKIDTGADGTCRHPIPATAYEIQVTDLDGNAHYPVDLAASACRLRFGKPVLCLASMGIDVHWIRIESAPARLVKAVDQDGQPIRHLELRVECLEEAIALANPWQRVGNHAVLTGSDGVYDANHVLAPSLEQLGQVRLRAAASGYKTALHYDPFHTLSPTPTQLLLTRHPTRRIRLRNGDMPLQHTVAIYAEYEGRESFITEAAPSPQGVIEFPCPPEATISVRLDGASGPLIARTKPSSDITDLAVDCAASLIVDGAGSVADVVCAYGSWEPAGEIDPEGRLCFTSLPPGEYDVGSRAMVNRARLSRSCGLSSNVVRLASGEIKHVQLDSPAGNLPGQCRVVGTKPSNIRVTLGSEDGQPGPLAFGPNHVWNSIDPQGRFTVSGARSRDPWVAYATIGVQGVAIHLGTFRLSAQPTIACRQLHVSTEGAPQMPMWLSIIPAQDGSRSFTPPIRWQLSGHKQTFVIPGRIQGIEVATSESRSFAAVANGTSDVAAHARIKKNGEIDLKLGQD